ncbi:MAG TPA: hypothetical protein VJY36_00135, partial [Candidatus Bathyarchaeia archaeon]|nr:hypothetical protein [Candidatus Bathyarchaeia archaeon]
MSKALIVYGTRYGATANTSEVIADNLRQVGYEVKIVEAKKEKDALFLPSGKVCSKPFSKP